VLCLYSLRIYRESIEGSHPSSSAYAPTLVAVTFFALYVFWGRAVDWYWKKKDESRPLDS
jgi:hypothetical protein